MKIKKIIYDFAGLIAPPSPNLNVIHKIDELLKTLGRERKVLDLGSGKKRISPEAVNIDINFYPGVDVIGDVHHLPFGDGHFDLVVARAVLEHVEDPAGVISHIHRVLKKDGYVYAEIPFLQPYHAAPGDFQRYTLKGIETLFSEFDKIDSGVCVGPTSAVLGLMQEYIAFFIGVPVLRTAAYFMLGWFFAPFRYLDLFLVKRKKSHTIASSLYFIGKKRTF